MTVKELESMMNLIDIAINDTISDTLYGDAVENAAVYASGLEEALTIVKHIVSDFKKEAIKQEAGN